MAELSMQCPVCHATITGGTQAELGWNYSAHMDTHKKKK